MKSAFALTTLAAYASATAAVDTCVLTDTTTNNTWNVDDVTDCSSVKDVTEIKDAGETTGVSWIVETSTVCTAAVAADAEADVVAKAAVNVSKKYVVNCATVGDTGYGVATTVDSTAETCVDTITRSHATGCRNLTEAEIAAEIAAAKALALEKKPLLDALTAAKTDLATKQTALTGKKDLEKAAKDANAKAQKATRTSTAEAVFVAQAALDTCFCTESIATVVKAAKTAVSKCKSDNATKVTVATTAHTTCLEKSTELAPAECGAEEKAKTDAEALTCTDLETTVTTAEALTCTDLETTGTTAKAGTCTTEKDTLDTKTAALTAAATAEAANADSDAGKAAIAAAAITQTAEDDATAAVATAQAEYDAQLVIVLEATNAVGTFDCDQEEGVHFDATSEEDAGQCVTMPKEDDTTCETCYVDGECYTMDTTDEDAIDFCGDAEDIISGGSGLVIGLILAVLAAIALGIVIYCFCCKSSEDDDYQKQN